MSEERIQPELRVIRDHLVLAARTLEDSLTIGRQPDNDLVLDDDRVSGHHGRLQREGAHWRYTDVGSTNGSSIAGGPVLRAGESWLLREDSQVLLGGTVLDLRFGEAANDAAVAAPDARAHQAAQAAQAARTGAVSAPATSPPPRDQCDSALAGLGLGSGLGSSANSSMSANSSTSTSTSTSARAGAGAARPEHGAAAPEAAHLALRPRLVVVLRESAGTVMLRGASAVIGRGAGCDVRIDDPSVSSLHARLTLQDGRWMLADLASRNGTRLGLRRVVGAEEVHDGDHIIIGAADLLFLIDDAPTPEARQLRHALDQRALQLAHRDRLLGPTQGRAARAALATGPQQLGEFLVTQGWLSPGAWIELQTEAHGSGSLRDDVATTRRRRRIVVALMLVAAFGVAAWLAITAALR